MKAAVNVGRARRVLERAGYGVWEVSIPAASGVLAPHRHDRAQLHLVLEGEYSESARGREHALGPGSVLFRPAGESHSNAFGNAEVHGMLIELDGTVAEALLPGILRDTPFYRAAATSEPLARAFDLEARRGDPESATAIAGLVHCLAAEVSRLGRGSPREGVEPAWLAEAAGVLRRRASEDLRLSRLAAIVGVPPVRLAAAFRRHFRCSAGEYLRRVRMARSRALLANSDAPIAEIAVVCGFFDQAHFSRAFKKHHGATPGEFRRSRRA